MNNLGANFYPKLVKISSELGMKPEDLLAVMVSESGLNPESYEKKFHGSGLVGFMPDTLKGLGYQGSWDNFIKLSGEEQLDYVKKLVQNNMKLNGGPFTSAAQYYVANLWPVALKLPGIRQGDPSTIFIEEHPETVTDKSGNKYSKKYYDLGFKITPGSESAAYKYNPLFHGSTKGAITFADMIKQIDKIKNNPIYKKALTQLQAAKGSNFNNEDEDLFKKYINKFKDNKTQLKDDISQVSNILNNYLQQVSANNKNLYKKHLTKNDFLLRLSCDNYTNGIELSRVICAALEEDLQAKAYTHTDGKLIEIECTIYGPSTSCLAAIKELTNIIVTSSKNIINTNTLIKYDLNKKSNLSAINYKKAIKEYRKFLISKN